MSEELELQRPVRGNAPPPALELLSGQFLLRIPLLDGSVQETLRSAASVREAFTGIRIDSGWLPPEVRRWGTGADGDWAVMHIAPALHKLEMLPDTAGPVAQITAPLPSLIFFGIGFKYYIWASKSEKLEPYRELYRCPLPNVEPDASICFGTYKPPRATASSIHLAWKIFITSAFNNHRCDGKSKQHKEDVRELLRALSDGTYPVDDLVRQDRDRGATLDQALRGFFETGEMPQ